MQFHPDKNPDPEAHVRFQEISAAYEVLVDPEAREMYDQYGLDGSKGHGVPGMSPEDLFGNLFNGAGFTFSSADPPRRKKGDDQRVPYEVSLEDLYTGKSVKMQIEKAIVCPTCSGSGGRAGTKPKKCMKCDGEGITITTRAANGGALGFARVTCSMCKGSGKTVREKDRCKKCKGEKTVKEKKRVDIHIERGMADGAKIVLPGEGDQEPGTPPGDVFFVLETKRHECFERSGADLLAHVSITLSEALLGFSRVILTHLDGRGINFSSPKGKIYKTGDTIALRGEGMPVHKEMTKGDLYVLFEVEMPTEEWLRTVDVKALRGLLPLGKPDLRHEVVNEAQYEVADIHEFGEAEEDWEDEELDDEEHPQCQHA